MTGKKHIVAYKIPNTNKTLSFEPSARIEVCPCGKNLFVVVGRYRKSKDMLYIYPKRYENARIYKKYDFGVFSMKNNLEKNGRCYTCDKEHVDLNFIHGDAKNNRNFTNFTIKVSNNKRKVTKTTKKPSTYTSTPTYASASTYTSASTSTPTKKPALTVEQKLEMTLDDIIRYNDQEYNQ